METRLDRFGRIVLPKEVRDDLALEPGDTLQVRETTDGILLTPTSAAAAGSPLRVIDGVLVHCGVPLDRIGDAVQDDRETRMRQLAGRVAKRRARRRTR